MRHIWQLYKLESNDFDPILVMNNKLQAKFDEVHGKENWFAIHKHCP